MHKHCIANNKNLKVKTGRLHSNYKQSYHYVTQILYITIDYTATQIDGTPYGPNCEQK
jgi:hypothetical protein